jgi:hypothetical protein
MNGDAMMPLKTLSATLKLGHGTEGWNLSEHPSEGDWTPPRTFTSEVVFAAPFSYTPVVHIGLTGFDIDQAHTSRVVVRAVDISPTGFKTEVSTWLDSRVYGVEVAWLAIGP